MNGVSINFIEGIKLNLFIKEINMFLAQELWHEIGTRPYLKLWYILVLKL